MTTRDLVFAFRFSRDLISIMGGMVLDIVSRQIEAVLHSRICRDRFFVEKGEVVYVGNIWSRIRFIADGHDTWQEFPTWLLRRADADKVGTLVICEMFCFGGMVTVRISRETPLETDELAPASSN